MHERIFIIISCNVAVIGEFINKKAIFENFRAPKMKKKMKKALINSQRALRESRFIQNNNFLLINLKTNCLIKKEMKRRRELQKNV